MSLIPENILKELADEKFKGQARIIQIDSFLRSLYEADHKTVTPHEVSGIFKDANMRSPKNQKKIRCGAFKVKEYFESIASAEETSKTITVRVKEIADGQYEISLRS